MLITLLATLTLSTAADAGTLYHYKDKNGTVHVVDSEASIPEEYRDQTKTQVTEAPEGTTQEAAAAADEDHAPRKKGARGKRRKKSDD